MPKYSVCGVDIWTWPGQGMGTISRCLFLFLQTIFADSGHTFPFLAEILGHTRLPMAKYSVCGRYHLTWPGCKGLSIPANFLRFNLGKLAGFNQSGSTRLISSTCCKGLSSFLLFRPTDMDQYSSYPFRVTCSHIWCCTQHGHFSLGSSSRMLVQLEQLFHCPEAHVGIKCRLLQLYLQRNMIRKHDFLALLQRTAQMDTLIGTYHMISLALAFSGTCWKKWKWFYKHLPSWTTGNIYSGFVEPQAKGSNPYIGGGSSQFSLDELQPYIIAENIPASDASFKFSDYVLQSELDNLENFVACDIPIHLLSVKLTMKQLRDIAACHGIITRAKTRLAEIQNAICNHMCEECHMYAAVFEQVNKDERILRRR